MTRESPDAAARQAIYERLDRDLYVEAGAGTGKTTSLVNRVERIVTSGRAKIDQVVAITFTRAAASELRSRIRERLEQVSNDEQRSSAERERADRALEEIDGAAFQTIDSFALSLLRERPLEAGLPPLIVPRDELEAEIAFADEWQGWLDAELSREDGAFREAVGRAMRLGMANALGPLRDIALEFHQNYDLLDHEQFEQLDSPRRTAFDDLIAEFSRVEDLVAQCSDPSDRLYVHVLGTVTPWISRVRSALHDEEELEYLLSESPRLAAGKNSGRKDNWGTGPLDVKQEVLDLLKSMQQNVDSERRAVAGMALKELLQGVKRMVLQYAQRRRQAGTLEFHDMLVLARELLASDPESRLHFQNRYPVVLVDEFQDTDPLQMELLTLLTRSDDGSTSGSLFRVGDPKQSIYRFRRADVSISEKEREAARERGDWLPLRSNHRSQRPIIEWVNHVFSDWMGRQRLNYGGLQAEYISLDAAVGAGVGDPPGAALPAGVRYFGRALAQKSEEVRRAEADDVASIVAAAGRGEFAVRDPMTGHLRHSGFGDVCILIRARTGIDTLEQALMEVGAPYSLEGQSLLFGTQEFRDLSSAMRAVDDPTDQVAVVAALRSAVFACSDEDIWLWASNGGRFDYSLAEPRGAVNASPPIKVAFDLLRELHGSRMSEPYPVTVERLIRAQRMIETGYLAFRRTETVRRLELFVEYARTLRDAGLLSLREFLAWVDQRREGRARAPESVMPDAGAETVRVMTVHAAKGLEFPIVILAGNASGMGRKADNVIVTSRRPPGSRVHVRLGRKELGFETAGYATAADEEGLADEAEVARLMYVASTRARDHLVISLYRRSTKNDPTPAAQFELCCGQDPSIWSEYRPVPGSVPAMEVGSTYAAELSVTARQRWIEQRANALSAAGRKGYVTATELKSGVAAAPAPKQPSPEALDEPWRRGRGALSLGRAVHGVLQSASFDGSDLEQLSIEQTRAHDLPPEETARVELLARKTLLSPSVSAAKGRRNCWRELWIAAPLGEPEMGEPKNAGTIEGTIDLIYEVDDGSLVIVDYKTDQVTGSTLEEKAQPYALQLGAYAWAVERLTSKRVSRAVLVFSSEAAEDRPAEYAIPDLAAAMASACDAARMALA